MKNKRQEQVDAINREIVRYERMIKPFLPPYVIDAMETIAYEDEHKDGIYEHMDNRMMARYTGKYVPIKRK